MAAEPSTALVSAPHRPKHRKGWVRWSALLLLVVVVTLVWCTIANRWTAEAWRTPAGYSGDAWWGLAHNKAVVAGELPLILPKYIHSLGAPFEANWNDYPSVEEGAAAWCALLAYLLGIFASQHAAVLSAHLFAAVSFYLVCRYLRYDPLLSVAAALLFAFSRYAMARGIFHLSLLFYWQVPLGLLVVWWCVAKAPFELRSRKLLVAIAVALAHATQNPYYTGLFLQFLVWAAFVCLLQRRTWWRVLLPIGLCVIVFAGFWVMNFDTFYSNRVNGPNAGIVSRSYVGIELYALKPLELLLPATHRIEAWQTWTQEMYFKRAMFIGEGGSPYLGIIGILGLGTLTWSVASSIASRARNVPGYFWYILWVLLYSVVGGVNGFIGVFGMVLYRGTNRYSIVILCLALMFLVRQLSRLSRRWKWPATAGLAAAMVFVGLWDQVTSTTSDEEIRSVAAVVDVDRQFTKRIDKKLPPDAMIFQLPVMDFPEVEPIVALADYSHFRPYLHSSDLRFSYGSAKGRPRERWQNETERLGPAAMVTILERYGFSAVIIARKGYKDEGAALIAGFEAAGRGKKISESGDFVCIALEPSPTPTLPPEFDEGWGGLEGAYAGNWRWSSGDAKIVLHNGGKEAKDVRITAGVGAFRPRKVDIYFRSEKIAAMSLEAHSPPVPVDTVLRLSPGKNIIHFDTDLPAELPGTGDPRKLAFRLTDFKVTEQH